MVSIDISYQHLSYGQMTYCSNLGINDFLTSLGYLYVYKVITKYDEITGNNERLPKSFLYHFYYLSPYHYRIDKRGNDDCSTLSLPKHDSGMMI